MTAEEELEFNQLRNLAAFCEQEEARANQTIAVFALYRTTILLPRLFELKKKIEAEYASKESVNPVEEKSKVK